MTEGIYLLHFDKPYVHAEHYLGWAGDIEERLLRHAAGNGSPLIKAVMKVDIPIQLVRIWPGADRTTERRMHKTGPKRLCPLCSPRALHRMKS